LATLKREGKVRYIGVSNFTVDQMRRVQVIAPIDSLQPPYSLINRGIESEILAFCQAHQIGVIVYSPMASGLLTGAMTPERIQHFPADDWRRNNPEFQEPKLSRNLALVDLLREIGRRHGRSPGQVAVAWTLRQSAVTGAIVGARRPSQVDGIIGAAEFCLPEQELVELATFLNERP
jgi:aryl-alcohol dehydrogenase-like predicted oxidoreductase